MRDTAPQTIYLAGRYGRREELAEYRRQLMERNWIVTSRWLLEDHAATEDDTLGRAKDLRRFAAEDYIDIQGATFFMIFTDAPEDRTIRAGRHVELGIALALDKVIYVIGPEEDTAFYHLVDRYNHYATFGAFLAGTPKERM